MDSLLFLILILLPLALIFTLPYAPLTTSLTANLALSFLLYLLLLSPILPPYISSSRNNSHLTFHSYSSSHFQYCFHFALISIITLVLVFNHSNSHCGTHSHFECDFFLYLSHFISLSPKFSLLVIFLLILNFNLNRSVVWA